MNELRRRIKPPQPKPKRWTLEQLWVVLAEWDGGGSAEHQACMDFLDWLGR